MDIRLARPTDAPLVFALSLDENAHLVRRAEWPATNPVLHTVARSLLPLAMPGRTWIARDGSNAALLEAHPRQYVLGWDVKRLAVRGEPDGVLSAAVQAVTAHLQSKRVPRLFAQCHPGATEQLRCLGFHALAREYVMVCADRQATAAGSVPIDSRYRMPQDAWPLHQLEREVTPSLVRQLEGLSSVDWSHKARDMSEIVVERDGRVVAWIGWRSRRQDFAEVGLLIHPDFLELAPTLLDHVLGQMPPGSRFVTRVRDYQVETVRAFEDAGFVVVGEEILMVKHAGVEFARAVKGRLRVARIPGVHAFPLHTGAGLQLAGDRAGGPGKDNEL